MTPRGSLVVVATGALSLFAYAGAATLDPSPLAAGPAATATQAATTGSGTIAGRVSFSGTAPAAQPVKLSADPNCVAMHKDGLQHQPVKVKDGGLADVLVYLKAGVGTTYPTPTEPVVLDQLGCVYLPSMLAMMAGQPLKIHNSDETLHNVHPRPTVNKEFNIGQPRKGMVSTKTFDKPELMIPTGCDVHPWMRAYISVLAHPFFAVTKDDGSYSIGGLPDGEYEVEAVHSQLKSIASKVTVKGGQTAKLDFAFKG